MRGTGTKLDQDVVDANFSSSALTRTTRAAYTTIEGKLKQGRAMTQYLISFDDRDMTFPVEEMAAVGAAAHAVCQELMDAGAFVFGGGLLEPELTSVVATDGTVTTGAKTQKSHYVGGMTIVDVPSRDEAIAWGAKIAAACRCAQEVREYMPDPAVYRAPTTVADPPRG